MNRRLPLLKFPTPYFLMPLMGVVLTFNEERVDCSCCRIVESSQLQSWNSKSL